MMNSQLLQKINNITAYGILFSFTLVISFLILYFGDWTIGDDSIYLNTTALGLFNNCADGFLPANGRLFPLAHFDYNFTLLLPFIPVVKAHYLLNSISFCLYVFCLWYVIRAITDLALSKSNVISNNVTINVIFAFILSLVFAKKLILITIVAYLLLMLLPQDKIKFLKPWLIIMVVFSIILHPMWSSDFFKIHTGTRLFAVLTALFIYLFYKFLKTDKLVFGIGAIITSLYLIFGYEYHFGLFGVFSVCMLLFYRAKSKNLKIVLCAILSCSILYVLIYCICILPNINDIYVHENADSSILMGIKKLFSWVKIYVIAFIIAFIRFYFIVFKKDRSGIFFDACLFTGIVGCCALIMLHMYDPYCHITNIIFVSIPVLYWMLHWLDVRWCIITFSLLVCLLISPYYHTTKERINVMEKTMPMVEKVSKLCTEQYPIVFCKPTHNDWIKHGLTESQCYSMFLNRFKSILFFYNRSSLPILEVEIDDCPSEGNNIIMLSRDWVDSDSIYNVLNKGRIKDIDYTDIDIYYK